MATSVVYAVVCVKTQDTTAVEIALKLQRSQQSPVDDCIL